jgi:hypothetical protein
MVPRAWQAVLSQIGAMSILRACSLLALLVADAIVADRSGLISPHLRTTRAARQLRNVVRTGADSGRGRLIAAVLRHEAFCVAPSDLLPASGHFCPLLPLRLRGGNDLDAVVAETLNIMGLSRHCAAFAREGIHARNLEDLTADDLSELVSPHILFVLSGLVNTKQNGGAGCLCASLKNHISHIFATDKNPSSRV